MPAKSKPAKGDPARDVDAYFARLPDDARATLERLRKSIQAAAPQALESISYQMPTFSYLGNLVSIAAWKNHVALYPLTTDIARAYKQELKPFEVVGSTIRIPIGGHLPATLVKKIVKARIADNEARAAARKARAAAKKSGGARR